MPAPFNFARMAALLGNGAGIGGVDPNASAQDLQGTLDWVKQFDPNASIGWEGQNQRLNFDNSLLPQNALGGHGILGIARGTPGSGEKLAAPGAVLDDPTYGRVTAPDNLREKGPSMVGILGPLLVGASVGGFPALFSALSGGAIGGGAASLGFAGNAALKAPQFLNNAADMFGGNQPTMSPQMMALLRLLSVNGGG